MNTPLPKDVHVLAGVIFDAAGRILLAQRPRGKDLAGYWEFPGGKIEPGETRLQALARELREELGIEIGPARPLTRVRHAYPHKTVLLDFWIVREFTGEVSALDGQLLKWCRAEDMASVTLLPADRPMLRLVHLPEELNFLSGPDYRIAKSVSDREPGKAIGVSCESIAGAASAAAAGADFVVLRTVLHAEEVHQVCENLFAPVFVSGFSLAQAWLLGATGIVSPKLGRC